MEFYCYVYVFLLLCKFCPVSSVSLCCSVYCLCVNPTSVNKIYHITYTYEIPRLKMRGAIPPLTYMS
jgi:hypothetical protein